MVKIIKHPLIDIKLTRMRDASSDHVEFRKNLNEIASLMVYEIMRDYKTKPETVKTPTGTVTTGAKFGKEIVVVPILRAGLGMVEGIISMVPEARTGHIGIYRDEKTFEAHHYYYKMPDVPKNSQVLVVDPMLATGGSANDSIIALKKNGFKNIKLVCLVGAPEGVKFIEKNHPEIEIYLAAQDQKLNESKYIIPGLGDAGDRIFGTKEKSSKD